MRADGILGFVQSRSLCQRLLSTVRHVSAKGYVLFSDRGKRKWTWAILVAVVSLQSYFVRQLLSALLLFTILFAVLTGLAGLYLLIDHAVYCSIVRAEPLARSFQSLAHQHLALPARVLGLPKGRVVHRSQKLDHN